MPCCLYPSQVIIIQYIDSGDTVIIGCIYQIYPEVSDIKSAYEISPMEANEQI